MNTEPTVEEVLAELLELFPGHDYIHIRQGCSWFGSGQPDRLVRITVTKYEWVGTTLSEAMTAVRQWHQGKQTVTREISSNGC